MGEVSDEEPTPDEGEELTLHGFDGSETTIRIGPGSRFVLDEAKARLEAMDQPTFRGVVTGLSAPGGPLNRPDLVWARRLPDPAVDASGPAVIMGGPWSGCELKRFAYFLAGALSTVMLPGDRVMPTEEIDDLVRRVMSAESARAMTDDERPDPAGRDGQQ